MKTDGSGRQAPRYPVESVDKALREDGVSSVAVAIRHPARGPVAALSVAAPVGRMPAADADRIASLLFTTSAQIGEQLAVAGTRTTFYT